MKNGMSVEMDGRIKPTYAFQISVDYFVIVQVTETADDADQLQFSERRILFLMRQTY